MTFQEIAEKSLGKDAVYDWAMPQEWFNSVLDTTGINPSGHIVWLYEGNGIKTVFGLPFGITLLGWIILTIVGPI